MCHFLDNGFDGKQHRHLLMWAVASVGDGKSRDAVACVHLSLQISVTSQIIYYYIFFYTIILV